MLFRVPALREQARHTLPAPLQQACVCKHGPPRALCIPRRNNELQFAGTYGETGVRYTLSLPAGDMEVRSRQARPLHDPPDCEEVAIPCQVPLALALKHIGAKADL